MKACDEFGAELFAAARIDTPLEPGLASHLRACEPCSSTLGELRSLVRDITEATPELEPRPETRVAVMHDVRTDRRSLAPPRPGRVYRLGLPIAIAAASLAAGILVVANLDGPATPEGVTVSPIFNMESISGLETGSAWHPGSVLSASKIASMELGAPVNARIVMGSGTRLRTPGTVAEGATLELLGGPCFIDRSKRSAAAPLVVSAGAASAETSDGRFTIERRNNGVVTVFVSEGSVTVKGGNHVATLTGPARVDVDPESGTLVPAPAEAGDATGWFAYPEVSIALATGDDGNEELVVTLRPSVPEELRIAPWDRFDPLFTLRVFREKTGLSEIEVSARHFARPPPQDRGDGTFLLKQDRPYTMHLKVDALDLDPGTWRAEMIYSASRPGGPWRGSRASNSLSLKAK